MPDSLLHQRPDLAHLEWLLDECLARDEPVSDPDRQRAYEADLPRALDPCGDDKICPGGQPYHRGWINLPLGWTVAVVLVVALLIGLAGYFMSASEIR